MSFNGDRIGMQVKTGNPATQPEYDAPRSAMSIAEFCKRYAIGRSSAYEEHRRGRLAFRKVGARSIILASEAERWAQSLPEAIK